MSIVKKQVYLTPELNRKLQDLSRQTNRSESQIMREAVAEYRPGSEAQPDPMADIIGMVDDRDMPSDLAASHDKYLYAVPGELDA
jgi:Ribbon-helix-helix protein, copG family